MSKVVAIMSMSLDGYIADLNDGVADAFGNDPVRLPMLVWASARLITVGRRYGP